MTNIEALEFLNNVQKHLVNAEPANLSEVTFDEDCAQEIVIVARCMVRNAIAMANFKRGDFSSIKG